MSSLLDHWFIVIDFPCHHLALATVRPSPWLVPSCQHSLVLWYFYPRQCRCSAFHWAGWGCTNSAFWYIFTVGLHTYVPRIRWWPSASNRVDDNYIIVPCGQWECLMLSFLTWKALRGQICPLFTAVVVPCSSTAMSLFRILSLLTPFTDPGYQVLFVNLVGTGRPTR